MKDRIRVADLKGRRGGADFEYGCFEKMGQFEGEEEWR